MAVCSSVAAARARPAPRGARGQLERGCAEWREDFSISLRPELEPHAHIQVQHRGRLIEMPLTSCFDQLL